MSNLPGTNKQLPDHAILDFYNKQTYLGNKYSYMISTNTPGATSETAILLLQNPVVTATGFPSGYTSLFCNLRTGTSITGSENVIFRVYLGPTFSAAGSAHTPLNLRPGNSNTSIATLSTGPTVSVNGSLVDSMAALAFSQVQSDLMIILDPGKTLLVTAQPSSDSASIQFGLSWYEL